MNKLVLCLIITCLQVFALTHSRSRSHAWTDPSDPDSTDWDSVKVIADLFEITQDMKNFFDTRILGNSTHSEILYQRGIVHHFLPNLYLIPVGHALINISINYYAAEYLFLVQLQDTYSKEVYEQVLQFGLPLEQALDPVNCILDDDTNTPSPINPPIPLFEINFVNSSALTYDLLAYLWNRALMDGTSQAGMDNITAEANEMVGQGGYASIQVYDQTVNVQDSGFKFDIVGEIWQDEEQTTFRDFDVHIELSTQDNSTTVVAWHIDSQWTTIPN